MKTVVELRYLDTRRFFSTPELARTFVETLARALGIGEYEFTLITHEVDGP